MRRPPWVLGLQTAGVLAGYALAPSAAGATSCHLDQELPLTLSSVTVDGVEKDPLAVDVGRYAFVTTWNSSAQLRLQVTQSPDGAPDAGDDSNASDAATDGGDATDDGGMISQGIIDEEFFHEAK